MVMLSSFHYAVLLFTLEGSVADTQAHYASTYTTIWLSIGRNHCSMPRAHANIASVQFNNFRNSNELGWLLVPCLSAKASQWVAPSVQLSMLFIDGCGATLNNLDRNQPWRNKGFEVIFFPLHNKWLQGWCDDWLCGSSIRSVPDLGLQESMF